MHCKLFEMERFCKTSAVSHQSCIAKAYCTGYFTAKVLGLPSDPLNLVSPVNDSQYAAYNLPKFFLP